MKHASFGILFLSIALYATQIVFYTKVQELILYGLYGAVWYTTLVCWPGITRGKGSGLDMLLLSSLSALGLGFVPHRLKLGGGFDLYVLLFPLIHLVTTFSFLYLRRKPSN